MISLKDYYWDLVEISPLLHPSFESTPASASPHQCRKTPSHIVVHHRKVAAKNLNHLIQEAPTIVP